MATSKTLTPTNVTIQIPEFTDQPDQRVNSNCIDKEADAINALNNNIANINTQISIQTKTSISAKTLTTTGMYFLNAGCTDSASGSAHFMVVYASGSQIIQIAYLAFENSAYLRSYYNSTWSNWKELTNA